MSYFESRLRVSFDDLNEIKKKLELCERLGIKNLILEPKDSVKKISFEFKGFIKEITQINIYYRNYVVNGKSLLGILMLAAGKGAKIGVEAVGDDADVAIKAILNLAKNKFNIRY